MHYQSWSSFANGVSNSGPTANGFCTGPRRRSPQTFWSAFEPTSPTYCGSSTQPMNYRSRSGSRAALSTPAGPPGRGLRGCDNWPNGARPAGPGRAVPDVGGERGKRVSPCNGPTVLATAATEPPNTPGKKRDNITVASFGACGGRPRQAAREGERNQGLDDLRRRSGKKESRPVASSAPRQKTAMTR